MGRTDASRPVKFLKWPNWRFVRGVKSRATPNVSCVTLYIWPIISITKRLVNVTTRIYHIYLYFVTSDIIKLEISSPMLRDSCGLVLNAGTSIKKLDT